VLADARGRMVGMRVPLSGEVAWLLAQGPWPYWHGDITAIAYGPASQ